MMIPEIQNNIITNWAKSSRNKSIAEGILNGTNHILSGRQNHQDSYQNSRSNVLKTLHSKPKVINRKYSADHSGFCLATALDKNFKSLQVENVLQQSCDTLSMTNVHTPHDSFKFIDLSESLGLNMNVNTNGNLVFMEITGPNEASQIMSDICLSLITNPIGGIKGGIDIIENKEPSFQSSSSSRNAKITPVIDNYEPSQILMDIIQSYHAYKSDMEFKNYLERELDSFSVLNDYNVIQQAKDIFVNKKNLVVACDGIEDLHVLLSNNLTNEYKNMGPKKELLQNETTCWKGGHVFSDKFKSQTGTKTFNVFLPVVDNGSLHDLLLGNIISLCLGGGDEFMTGGPGKGLSSYLFQTVMRYNPGIRHLKAMYQDPNGPANMLSLNRRLPSSFGILSIFGIADLETDIFRLQNTIEQDLKNGTWLNNARFTSAKNRFKMVLLRNPSILRSLSCKLVLQGIMETNQILSEISDLNKLIDMIDDISLVEVTSKVRDIVDNVPLTIHLS